LKNTAKAVEETIAQIEADMRFAAREMKFWNAPLNCATA